MTPAIETEIRGLEERLLDSEVRRSPSDLDRILADGFREFGSSGRVFTKQAIIASLSIETGPFAYELSDFAVMLLTPAIALATYRLTDVTTPSNPRRTNRSSLWVQRNGSWRIFSTRAHASTQRPHNASRTTPAEPSVSTHSGFARPSTIRTAYPWTAASAARLYAPTGVATSLPRASAIGTTGS